MFAMIGVVCVLVGGVKTDLSCGHITVWEKPFPTEKACLLRLAAVETTFAPDDVPLSGKFACVEEEEIQ